MSIKSQFEENGTPLSVNDGNLPTGPLTDGTTIPINTTFNNGQYLNNVPEGINPDRIADLTDAID